MLKQGLFISLVFFVFNNTFARPVDESEHEKNDTVVSYTNELIRTERRVSGKLPAMYRSQEAWSEFESKQTNGSWKVMWDQDTGIPLRVYGSGISAPNSIASKDAALTHAKQMLAENIKLLAPGSKVEDFTLVSNVVHNGVRSLGFQQNYNGIKVHGGQLSFRYKYDRMIAMASEAFPLVEVSNNLSASKQMVESKAVEWIKTDVDASASKVTSASEPIILPIVGKGLNINDIKYSLARSVMVKSNSPVGKWEVFVNANTAEPIMRFQRLMFGVQASGQALYSTPERWPGGAYADFPASFADLVVNSNNVTTDVDGGFIWNDNPTATIDTTMTGTYVNLTNEAGAEATANFQINEGGSFTWSDPTTEFVDAQITSFVHANFIKEYVRPWNPNLAWLDLAIPVTVNINDTCNAFSDGNSINFFREGGGCNNTGRLVDVVYHEFGHSYHQQSIIQGVGSYDGSMGEGAGDFLSATVANDPSLGIGFFTNGNSLREIDPPGTEAVFPDDITGSVHSNGLIYSGAFWDLRKALIIELGEAEGVALTERLFYATLQRAVDMPSSFVEALVEDDDDGDLSNGTPHFCTINDAFKLHGLTGAQPNTLFGDLSVNGFDVSVTSENTLNCGVTVDDMNLEWQSKSDPNQNGSVLMTLDSNNYTGTIPFTTVGEVVQYRVVANFSDDSSEMKPNNPADPWYEKFNGSVEIISCTNFDTDPALDGWTHSLTSGTPQAGADDWEWGIPMGNSANSDPTSAYSGTNVYGNDLGNEGFNGLYQSNIVNETTSPVINVSGYESVRLQYQRWLNVEDGIYDQASIYANDNLVWTNFSSGANGSGAVQHQENGWSFRDVDLTSSIVNNTVQLRFEIASDGGLEFGGWTLDDVCVVGYGAIPFEDLIFTSSFEEVMDE